MSLIWVLSAAVAATPTTRTSSVGPIGPVDVVRTASTATLDPVGRTHTASAAIDASVRTSSAVPDFYRAVRAPEPVGLEPGRLLSSLPGSIVELAFAPLTPIIKVVEKYHLVERYIQLITNDERTFAVTPIVEPFSSSGIGFGAIAAWNDPLGSPDRAILLGLVRINGDRQVSLNFGRRLPVLSGRAIRVSASYDVDHDNNWFGIGGGSLLSDQRLLQKDEILLTVGLGELAPQFINIDGSIDVGYRRVELRSGRGSTAPSFELGGDVAAPPGFGKNSDYLQLSWDARYDSRDGVGRTTEGVVLSFSGDGSYEFGGSDEEITGGLRTTGQATWLVPVLPRNRVLVLSAGFSAALPIFDVDEVALHQLVTLGGPNRLRGYQPNRFYDRLGYWGTAEYRFLLSNYAGSLVGFSAALFVDVGNVGRDWSDLFTDRLSWSAGIGLRAETDYTPPARVQVAVSPDGIRFSVGVGEWF